ncbi:MAG: hypothetical protein SPL46_06820, partial [Selenomonadaceae bacterium]|nr:hypothetical protein [Selenomonadaceae bacterium]
AMMPFSERTFLQAASYCRFCSSASDMRSLPFSAARISVAALRQEILCFFSFLILLCKSPRAQAAGAARLAGNPLRTGAQCLQSGRLCVEFILFILSSLKKGDAKQQAQPKLCLLFMTNALPR